jgi:cellulose synthase/poly-beta-1,6-N-acetylglucosamine synthase-like glycosyltransferase
MLLFSNTSTHWFSFFLYYSYSFPLFQCAAIMSSHKENEKVQRTGDEDINVNDENNKQMTSNDIHASSEDDKEDELDKFGDGLYSVADFTRNEYTCNIDIRNAEDIIVVADKTESDRMYCVSKNWISFAKGRHFVPKLRDVTNKISVDDEEAFMRQLITEGTKVDTEQISVRPQNVNCRGGQRNRRSKGVGTQKNRTIVITWKRYLVKTVLKTYRE